MTTHILEGGRSLCGRPDGPPTAWPEGEGFIGNARDPIEFVDCDGCIKAFKGASSRPGAGLFDAPHISYQAKIVELERELKMRRGVYPRLIRQQKMTQRQAEARIDTLKAILQDYYDGVRQ